MLKVLLVIIDGLSDEPIPQLGNKTPLEVAETPNLDFLAKNGICGTVLPSLFPGEEEPSSHGTHVALFSYKDYILGRGPYEAAGIGMKMKKGDVALRANFGTVDKNLVVIDRRAGRIKKTKSLVKVLQGIKIEGLQPPHQGGELPLRGKLSPPDPPAKGGPLVKFLIKKSWGHRAVLILRGKNLSSKITDGDPYKIGTKVKKILPLDKSKEAKFTAGILNQFLEKAHQILKNHSLNKKRVKKGLLPGNYFLVRGAGKFKKVPSFKKRYNLKAAYIAGGALYKGVAKILGMKEIFVKGATGFPNTNLKGKILAAKRALKKYDFVFLHIKAADNLAEDGNFLEKKKFIEKIDKNLKPILNLKNTLIVITADHSTCSLLKRHCKKSIPILIYKRGIKPDYYPPATLQPRPTHPKKVENFSERACKKGKLGKMKQINLMPKVLLYSR